MQGVTLQIVGKDDHHEQIAEQAALTIEKVIIKEGATEGGRTGVAITLVDTNGKHYVTTTTARIVLNGIAPAIRGAMYRFNDDPDKA
jgi:hypothetical protein